MNNTYYLGPCPAEEDPVQVGDENYAALARAECLRYIETIRQVCGTEPEGARLTVKSQPHDYGSYLEVVVHVRRRQRGSGRLRREVRRVRADDRGPNLTSGSASQPGAVFTTIGATHAASNRELTEMVRRHLAGDWGDLCDEDKKANDAALTHGQRILSSYKSASGEKLWVITRQARVSRSSTCVMTPSEY